MTATRSRRAFLAGTGLAVVGAVGGVVTGLVVKRPHHSNAALPAPRPEVLLAAVAAERERLALVDAALRAHVAPAAILRQLRANHLQHLTALTAAADEARGAFAPSVSPSPSSAASSAAPPAAPTRAQLRSGEAAAGRAAAARAAALTGRDATVLAAIAACEATHAELLA